MLVLSRKRGESVVVGGAVGFERLLEVTVLEIRRANVRLGFQISGDRRFGQLVGRVGNPSYTPAESTITASRSMPGFPFIGWRSGNASGMPTPRRACRMTPHRSPCDAVSSRKQFRIFSLSLRNQDPTMANPRPTGQSPRQQDYQAETVEPAEEVLLADVRNGLTPRQMVEAKLQALLGKMSPGSLAFSASHHSSSGEANRTGRWPGPGKEAACSTLADN